MPRRKSDTREALVRSAMQQFWRQGFAATSMDDLVRATGVSRHGIYAETAGRDALFLECLALYRDQIASPAMAHVERSGATLDAVIQYFDFQIARGQTESLLGLGCLMANSMTEVATHDPAVAVVVARHNDRLRMGFLAALVNPGGGGCACHRCYHR